MNKSIEEAERRFWSKVDIRGPDECWQWLGNKSEKGYGLIRFTRGNIRAHREAWELINGPIPQGLFICHHCDNPGCINPTHLFLATPADNMADKVRKDRQVKGESHSESKLINGQVISIRNEYAKGNTTYRKLASKYNVVHGQIGRIIRRENWMHI